MQLRRCLLYDGLLACLLAVLFSTVVNAQSEMAVPAPETEAGRAFITNYTSADYGANTQNWAVTQDNRGVLYIGNGSGVLEYDGTDWNLIPLPKRTLVRSLARDADGHLWVGGRGDFGYLAPDSRGQMQFVSLLDKVPEAHRDFADVWMTHPTDEGVYFQTYDHLFRWDGREVKVLSTDRLGFSFYVDGTLYVQQAERGLTRLTRTASGDTLVLIPGSENLTAGRFTLMLPYGDGRLLVGTIEGALYLYDPKATSGQAVFTQFVTEADALLAQYGAYRPGAVLPDGRFAIGTTGGGLVVIDRDGRLLQHIDQEKGLANNSVFYTFEDRTGDLWLGLDNGVARLEASSPLTRFGAEQGLAATLYNVVRGGNGLLYVGTAAGMMRLEPQAAGGARLVPVPSPAFQFFSLLPIEDGVLAGGSGGLYLVRQDAQGNDVIQTVRADVNRDYSVYSLRRWSRDPRLVLVGLDDGLGVVLQTGGGWQEVGRVPGVPDGLATITEDEDGVLWLGGLGVFRVRLPDALVGVSEAEMEPLLEQTEVTIFGEETGLPTGLISTHRVGDAVYATGLNESVYRFDQATQRFIPDDTFAPARAGNAAATFWLSEDDEGRVWVAKEFGAPSVALPQPDGSYRIEQGLLARLGDLTINYAYPEPDGTVWFVAPDALVRLDARRMEPPAAFPPLVRRVMAGEDSILYAGGGAIEPPTLNASHGQLQFAFAAPGQGAAARYRTRLAGFDDQWSGYGAATERTYTNLPPGRYTFEVQAQGASEMAAYTFSVLPAWYRSWWAYLLYAIGAVGLVGSLVRTRTQHLEARQRELEQTVEERTHELKQRVEELAVINSVQEGLVRELDIQAIYDLVGDRVRDLFDAQSVIIATFDHEAGVEYHRYNYEKGAKHAPPSRPIDLLRQRLIETREPILINEDFIEALVGMGYDRPEPVPGTVMPQAVLFVPLIVGETVRGYVSLQNVDHEHAFSESDVRLLTTLANSMSVSLENARLFAETTQRATELDTVNEISRALVSQLDFDALVHLVGEQVRETFQADIVYVALLDREADMLRFPYGYGEDFPALPMGKGLASKIITSREPLLINRDIDEVRAQLKTEKVGKSAASYLGVPILVGEEAIGVISAQSTREEGRFDGDDLRLLSTIAANVGVALQNAEAYQQLNAALSELQQTQQQLVTQEKMASLGALTAGIAHEIKNPLNFINNFAALNAELADELREELAQDSNRRIADVQDDLDDLLSSLKTNARQIVKHGKRADAIVKSMMQHASGGGSERYRVELNPFVDEYVNLAFHGKRAQMPDFSVRIERDYDERAGSVEMAPQELGRVLVNLLTNAFDAVQEQASRVNGQYDPTVVVRTQRVNGRMEIRIKDNGLGMPEAVKAKIFEPFFTTKPTGSGTGLGLSLAYDIVTQRHGGALDVESREGEGATFIVSLPLGGSETAHLVE